MSNDCRAFETKAVHGNKTLESSTGSVSFPIYQSATFRHEGLNQSTGYDYSRLQNPTREQLEKTVAILEGGRDALAYSTGMAAISSFLTLFKTGDHIIISDDLYGGTYRIVEEIYRNYGIEATYVDTTSLENVNKSILENTKAIFIETPTNPTMKITDIKGVCKIAKEHNILTAVDNTFLTPYFQKPLELGADIVIHSGTKFLGGHNDTLAGFVVLNDEKIIDRLRLIHKSVGAVLSPFDSWLILRGIKTLAIRLEKQQENAMKIANWLKEHKCIEEVFYPGLPEHKGHEIIKAQASGYGAMISFTVDNIETVERVLEKVKVIIFAESLGGVETLITYPYIQTHGEMPKDVKDSIGVTDKLLRLSVGIENVDDIIIDLKEALEG